MNEGDGDDDDDAVFFRCLTDRATACCVCFSVFFWGCWSVWTTVRYQRVLPSIHRDPADWTGQETTGACSTAAVCVICLWKSMWCCVSREPSDDERVLLRRRASDPPSLSSLQTPDGEFRMDSVNDSSDHVLFRDQTHCWQWSLQRQTCFSAWDVKLWLLLLFISGGSGETYSLKHLEDCQVSRKVWWVFHCWCIVLDFGF